MPLQYSAKIPSLEPGTEEASHDAAPAAAAAQVGRTALVYAAVNGHEECVAMLLKGGADVTAKNNVRRPGAALRPLRPCLRGWSVAAGFVRIYAPLFYMVSPYPLSLRFLLSDAT